MQNPLERKKFVIKLEVPRKRLRGYRVETIEIPQATINQTMEFFRKKDDFWEVSVIIAYLEKFRGDAFSKKVYLYLTKNGDELKKLWNETFLYWIEIERNFPEWWGEWESKWAPEGSFFVFLAKEIATPIPVILNEMTWEQIRELTIWLKWNANQLTDDGKLRNQAFQYKEKFEKENDMEAIRAALHEDLEAPYDQN